MVTPPIAWAQTSASDEAFDPSDEDLKGEGLIGPPRFNQSDSSDADTDTNWSPPSVPAWSHPAAQQFQDPLTNSRSSWNPIQSSSSSPAPPAVHQQGSNDDAWNLWMKMADQQKQPAPPASEYGAAARNAGFGRGVGAQPGQPSGAPPGENADFVTVPSPQQVASGRWGAPPNGWGSASAQATPNWTQPMPPQVGQGTPNWTLPMPQQMGQGTPNWTQPMPPHVGQGTPNWSQPMPPQVGQWGGGQVPQAAWQAPIPPGAQQVPSTNFSGNQSPSFNLGASATQTQIPQAGAQAPDALGGFMNWLGQMPNPFNQGQTAQAGLQQAASSFGLPNGFGLPSGFGLQQAGSFRLPDMTPTDPNNPLSSPMASMLAGAVGSWVTQQMRSNNSFQLGLSPSMLPPPMLQPSMPSPSSLPSLFPTDLRMEANGVSKPPSEDQSILDSELADSLLSSNHQFPTGSNSGSRSFSSRPTSFRGPLGIPVPGLLGNALASQRNKFAVNYLLNRSLKGSGFGIRLR